MTDSPDDNGLPENGPSESRPSESRPSESRPSESRPSESRPPESRPPESRPPESRPPESRPPYLKLGRLQDVLALIQILGFRSDTSHWTEDDVKKETRNYKPASANSWIDLAREHPEFFRVRDRVEKGKVVVEVALFMRYGVRHTVDSSGKRVRPALPVESASILFDIAKKLYDIQWSDLTHHREHRLKWIIAIVAALASFGGAVVGAWLKGA